MRTVRGGDILLSWQRTTIAFTHNFLPFLNIPHVFVEISETARSLGAKPLKSPPHQGPVLHFVALRAGDCA